MPINPTQNKKIHHITHYTNLISIINESRLYCGNELHTHGVITTNIGHSSLKQRRGQHPVSVPSGGTLNDYVPFFFTTRPPMLIAIEKGSVADYRGTQREIIYLVTSIEKILESDCIWCFTDGHAVEAITSYFDNLDYLSKIDWEVIAAWDYRPTSGDPDRERKKQAEFLVKGYVPWDCIESIIVKDDKMLDCVHEIIKSSNSPHRPTININRNWYYNPRRPQ